MQKAAGSAKQATCLLSLWFTGDGMIQAVQLAKASGFPLIGQACLLAALGRRFEGLPEGHSGGRTFFLSGVEPGVFLITSRSRYQWSQQRVFRFVTPARIGRPQRRRCMPYPKSRSR